jgi:hypothetical protein
MKEKDVHLNEDQILLSLVDEKDLSGKRHSHLLDCAVCQKKRMSLMSDLERLGEMARDFAPLPEKKLVRPLREPRHFSFRLPAFAAGLASVVLIASLWSLTFFTDSSKQMTAQLSMETEISLDLVDDILGESILPQYYLDISAASYSYFDDEFLEFLVPTEMPFNSI